MNWVYRFDERALKEPRKFGKQAQLDIVAYLDERIAGDGDPRRFGKGLKADLAGLWRYRVGDYRILCQTRDGDLLVLVAAPLRGRLEVARAGAAGILRARSADCPTVRILLPGNGIA